MEKLDFLATLRCQLRPWHNQEESSSRRATSWTFMLEQTVGAARLPTCHGLPCRLRVVIMDKLGPIPLPRGLWHWQAGFMEDYGNESIRWGKTVH